VSPARKPAGCAFVEESAAVTVAAQRLAPIAEWAAVLP
jgi:hypothetical protein